MYLGIVPDPDLHPDQKPDRVPGFFTRLTMEMVWTIEQQQLFAISGIKKDA